jgi:hypothetical protein
MIPVGVTFNKNLAINHLIWLLINGSHLDLLLVGCCVVLNDCPNNFDQSRKKIWAVFKLSFF